APIERRLGEIAGVTEMTSTSNFGSTGITIQFDLNRRIDGAARDVQAALNAAATDLPSDLPTAPSFRKFNPSSAPIMILAITASNMPVTAVYDHADTVIAPRIAQVPGVADVQVSGADQPAIRISVDPGRLAAMGLSVNDVRTALLNATAISPLGSIEGNDRALTIATNDQLRTPEQYGPLIVKVQDGNVVRLQDIATIELKSRNAKSLATFNGKPAVLLIITKQPDANVLDTVDAIKALIPDVKRWVPAGLDVQVLSDRTLTLRASVHEMEFTLLITILLVMAVVFMFMRRGPPTLAAGITVPLSLAGTFALMWASGFSINNISLLAIIVAVGFVVDDAIVMIENVYSKLEDGMAPLDAAREGAREIGFTVVSISISLAAAFIPLLFQGGVIGRMLQEFSWTLLYAIMVSTVVSLSVTPVICAYMIKSTPKQDGWFGRLFEGTMNRIIGGYSRSLGVVVKHPSLMLVVLAACIYATVQLFITLPKGLFPQDDTGFVFGQTEASADVSYETMVQLQQKAVDMVLADPAIEGVGSSLGATGPFGGSMNQGRLFINLKPLAERDRKTTDQVIARLRPKLAKLNGIQVFMFGARDVRVGGRQSKSEFQYTFWSQSLDDLNAAVIQATAALQKLPQLADVSSDRNKGGLQVDITIDRLAAARLGVSITAINDVLNSAFAQRQIATIYQARNQYKVVLEVDQRYQRTVDDILRLYVPGTNGVQVPLSNIVSLDRGLTPLAVNHTGPFPSATISFNVAPDVKFDDASKAIAKAIADLRLPATVNAEPSGDAKTFTQSSNAMPILIAAALISVYIVLGILYESYVHPLTILSTLPSAGIGALLALWATGIEISIIAVIGIILLIGIVKKNGIMLVDFALHAERYRGLTPERAILDAAVERFRPILMTTLASLLGAVPLVVAEGPGSELRRPLGVAIIGGLLVSQILTLYTTPAVYLLLDRAQRFVIRLFGRRPSAVTTASPTPAE
ncbi:MAG: efflux RND transporter permease subunit, partial [Hyphomicrobiaceae bacterium]|nr:efflux RND transporter permease subunit [Hyphomicrobiaceae bacterium]